MIFLFVSSQQFGKILDVEIIFNERGSKVILFDYLEYKFKNASF